MRRISLALALIGAVAVTGCTGGKAPAVSTGSGTEKGSAGNFFYVNLFTVPEGGTVRSSDNRINCGAAAGATLCGTLGQTQYLWAQTVTLTATPVAPNVFISWAGDCSGTGTCVLTAGADKTVVAVFGPAGSGHGNFTSGLVHGPAYDAFAAAPTTYALKCTTCHGADLLGQSIAPSCATCHAAPTAPGAPGTAAAAGLVVAIQGVNGTTVNFTLKDNAGNAVDPSGADGKNQVMGLRAALASFATSTSTGAPTVTFVLPYATRTGSAGNPSTSTMPALGTTPGANTLTRGAGVGEYVFTFPTTVTYDAAAVAAAVPHTVWIQATRQEAPAPSVAAKTFTAVNAQFNFNPQTGAPVAGRQVANTAGCNKCHAGFKPETATNVGGFHGYGRIDAAFCDACHNPGRTNQAADAATFVHRIHFGKSLTSQPTLLYTGTQTTGYQGAASCSATAPCVCTPASPCAVANTGNLFHNLAATYPQDILNCGSCHDGAAQGIQWQTHPTRNACGSCHDALSFADPGTHGPSGYNATDDRCTICHSAVSIANNHIPVIPGTPALTAGSPLPAGAVAITYDISAVGTWIDPAVTTVVTRRPQITFKLKKGAADIVFATYVNSATELTPDYTGSPTAYFAWAEPQDGIAAPADFNVSANVSVKTCWQHAGGLTPTPAGTPVSCNLLFDPATGYYTIQLRTAIVSANAKLLTGGLGYTSAMTQTNLLAYPGGLRVTPTNVWKVATGFTGRRTVVETAGCTDCHAQLGVEPTFHSGGRNDAPSCSFCHNVQRTSNGWSGNASTFIHAIHGSGKREQPYSWAASACATGFTWDAASKRCTNGTSWVTPDFWPAEIEYPNNLTNCDACHVAGAVNFGAAASAAAVPNLLWSTVATGAITTTGTTNPIRNSPYVTAQNYGLGFNYCTSSGSNAPCNSWANIGVTYPAASTTLVSSPIAAACFSCHDSAAATTHIASQGGELYQPRGAGFIATQETCLTCHGKGKGWDVEVVH
jgi:OmcA/MtrC family decaheme c-type cytochrome